MDTFVLSLLRVSWFYPVIRGNDRKSKATMLHIRYRVKIIIIYYFKYMFYKDSQVAEKLLISGSPSRLTLLETIKDKQC